MGGHRIHRGTLARTGHRPAGRPRRRPRRRGTGRCPDSVRTLAYGLACALLDIHGAGLVHRDLKPSNVLVTIDGPRVIDFGIARALDAVPGSTLTSTGMRRRLARLSCRPSRSRDEPVSPASDVFCMGAVLAYAATGQTPFGGGGGGVHAVMFRIATEEPDLDGHRQSRCGTDRRLPGQGPGGTARAGGGRRAGAAGRRPAPRRRPGCPPSSSPNWGGTRSSCWTRTRLLPGPGRPRV